MTLVGSSVDEKLNNLRKVDEVYFCSVIKQDGYLLFE